MDFFVPEEVNCRLARRSFVGAKKVESGRSFQQRFGGLLSDSSAAPTATNAPDSIKLPFARPCGCAQHSPSRQVATKLQCLAIAFVFMSISNEKTAATELQQLF